VVGRFTRPPHPGPHSEVLSECLAGCGEREQNSEGSPRGECTTGSSCRRGLFVIGSIRGAHRGRCCSLTERQLASLALDNETRKARATADGPASYSLPGSERRDFDDKGPRARHRTCLRKTPRARCESHKLCRSHVTASPVPQVPIRQGIHGPQGGFMPLVDPDRSQDRGVNGLAPHLAEGFCQL
jgi:hypothetical protein